MSKPTPYRMPTSRSALPLAAETWVEGDKQATAPPVPAEKPARLTIDLPPDLHARFKVACARNKKVMVGEVRRFIEEWTQKHE